MIKIYDCEVLEHDWCVVFTDVDHLSFDVIANDPEGLKNYLTDIDVLIGFNNKRYDRYIIEGIVAGRNPKDVNDDIIVRGLSPFDMGIPRLNIIQVDLMDDMRVGTSLKSFEAHSGYNIVESSIPFDYPEMLTPSQLEELITYCKYDVESTFKLYEIRKDYLETKFYLGEMCDLDKWYAASLTNAKLTAVLLGAVQKTHTDGREYEYPNILDKSIIPDEILKFFETIRDTSIPDDELFSTHYDYALNNLDIRYSWGGVHGSVQKQYAESDDEYVVQNRDVASLYPSLICLFNYQSRNMSNPDAYKNLRDERIEAKKNGDKKKANYLKCPLNTVSGAQEDKYNALYDPKPTRSLRISGQLFISTLVFRLIEAIPDIEFLNINTDGIMYRVRREYLSRVDDICKMWEYTTGFELETDEISKVWIKDVNNLLILMENGKVKKVGGALNYGITNKGSFAINNTATICKDALVEYFIHGTPVEVTIHNCDDIFKFQIIAKASHKYRDVVHIINGEPTKVQMCNRVYATANESFGNLLKYSKLTDNYVKVPDLPEHCVIDNANDLTVNDIDLNYYVERTNKLIKSFIKE